MKPLAFAAGAVALCTFNPIFAKNTRNFA